ncbi:conserved hypothetical protein [Candidatus Glomeribacter gigasporarum BEG34]|uniref:Helix-turn-helix domain-containing protein n=1 Tax=Candidatus Glomeribacter gigasporarum BEG34 TaxID=1070319 RepID=G2J7C5_9BURK|nr:conserved hypothetical protein [Candidatus Glomeribacter gigasporarum BEG34]
MSTIIQAACWPLQLPPTAKFVLILLADNANDQGVCWPSIPKICERTCFSERTVHGAIKWLEQRALLRANRSNGRHTSYILTPQEYSEPPQELRSNHKEPSLEPSEEPSKGACASRAALCELKRPDWLPEDAWRDWVSYRKTHKSRFTEKAAELSLCELAKLRERGFEPRAVIEQSILSGWTGLFPLKDRAGTGPPGLNRQVALEAENARAKAMLFGPKTEVIDV